MVLRTARREARPRERHQRRSKLSYSRGGHHAGVHSDQIGLMMATQEAGPCERRPQTLKGEMENKSRKPADLIGNRHLA